jgi:uncharacterized protein
MENGPFRGSVAPRKAFGWTSIHVFIPFLLGLTLLVGGSASCAGEAGNGAPPGDDLVTGQAARIPPRGLAWVIFGADTVVAEVARTDAERARGLMEREELPEGRGMIFVFPDVAIRSFWMQNTYIPLDIAFMDSEGVIVDIQAMEPLDETFTSSAAPAMFALEVPQGWFGARDIGVGQRAVMVFGAT